MEYADYGVRWHEEPVTSDDLEGLRLLRDQGPPGMDIAAGEYGWDLPYFRNMLDAGAVDCLQADVTRCGGITTLLMTGALCHAHAIDLSTHGAPQVSAHVLSAVMPLRHLEYFHDHVRLERLLFDGVLEPEDGMLRPDRPARNGTRVQARRRGTPHTRSEAVGGAALTVKQASLETPPTSRVSWRRS